MIWLGIDTVSSVSAVYLKEADSPELLAEIRTDIGMGHAEILLRQIEDALNAADLNKTNIGAVAVAIGPGSFTGVRVGLSAANAIGLALNVPVRGVSTLSALAMDASRLFSEPYAIALDARRNQIYWQDFSPAGAPLSEPKLVSLDHPIENPALHIAGSGAKIIADTLPHAINTALEGQSTSTGNGFFAAAFAHGIEDKPLLPLYLRSADAKQPQKSFFVERQT